MITHLLYSQNKSPKRLLKTLAAAILLSSALSAGITGAAPALAAETAPPAEPRNEAPTAEPRNEAPAEQPAAEAALAAALLEQQTAVLASIQNGAAFSALVLPEGVTAQEDGTFLLPDQTVFDPYYYGLQNQDVVRTFGSGPDALLNHYLKYGIREGRLPASPFTEKDSTGAVLAPEQTKDGQKALENAAEAAKQLQAMGNGDPFSLLCIGNSITQYGYNELWWGYWGMGATSREKDYVHVLTALLSTDHTVTAQIRNFTMWESPEMFGLSRDNALPLLDDILSTPCNAVILQIGENINSTAGLDRDYRNLILRIRQLEPDAQIVIVGDFWPNAAVERIEKAICRDYGLSYVNLSDIRTPAYHLGVGTVVSGDDGYQHTVINSAVAAHPGDAAMMIIAQRIYSVLKK